MTKMSTRKVKESFNLLISYGFAHLQNQQSLFLKPIPVGMEPLVEIKIYSKNVHFLMYKEILDREWKYVNIFFNMSIWQTDCFK